MSDNKDGIGEFLNAKAMLTPGACGALAMSLSNTIGSVVHAPQKWICLAISFLMGTVVLAGGIKSLWQKVIFYVLNSLIIFSMAAGTNWAIAPSSPSTTAQSPAEPTIITQKIVEVRTHTPTGVATSITTNNLAARFPAVKLSTPVPRQFLEQWR